MTIIELSDWEYDWAFHVAQKRQEANESSKDRHYYDRRRMQPDSIAQVAACCCELAVAKHINRYWDGSYWRKTQHNERKHLPDVGDDVEVKRIREKGNPLVVRKKDLEHNHFVVCAYAQEPDFRVVTIIGGGRAAKLWPLGEPADYDEKGETRRVPQRLLWEVPSGRKTGNGATAGP